MLWGSDNLTAEECINDSAKVTYTIMSNLRSRVSAKVSLSYPSFIPISNILKAIRFIGLDGLARNRRQTELQHDIMGAFPKHEEPFSITPFSILRMKSYIEGALVSWVIENINAFPEFKAMPFVFTHVQPVRLSTILLFSVQTNKLRRLRLSP